MSKSGYIAFLRAINVGGRVVKMDRLRALFEELKLRNVSTFIASGNVIFDSTSSDESKLSDRIEQHLAKALGYPVATFLRTPDELTAIVEHNAFSARELAGPVHGVYVGLLKTAPPRAGIKAVEALNGPQHEFRIQGRQLYWLARISTADSKISGGTLEKALAMPLTVRNITSLRKLAAKLGG